uniref:Protein quiver n=1 Tax=Syphacia muris TaxID=451379 RepID=A0A0N5AZ80_9BILA
MCNYQFIDENRESEDVNDELPHSQSCSFQYSVENTEYRYNSCQDPWCLTLLTQNISSEGLGQKESTIRGCQSWLLHRALEVQDNIKLKSRAPAYVNLIKVLLKQPRCRAIVDPMTPIINGSQQACIDFSFQSDGSQKRAKLCCCRGLNECNQNVSWIDEGRQFNNSYMCSSSWIMLTLMISVALLLLSAA